jgi:hypothetical protein
MTSLTNNSSSDFHRNLIDEKGIDAATGFSPEGQQERFRVILNRCLRESIIGKKVLDYGCNVGGLLDHVCPADLLRDCIDYTGVDLVTEFLVRLKEKHTNAKTLMGCITDDDVFAHLKKEGPYDYVIASGAFCYAEQVDKHPLMLQRLWDLTGDTLVVNFLASFTESERRTSKINHCIYHPTFGIRVAEQIGCRYFTVYHDYRPNDFTAVFYRNPVK